MAALGPGVTTKNSPSPKENPFNRPKLLDYLIAILGTGGVKAAKAPGVQVAGESVIWGKRLLVNTDSYQERKGDYFAKVGHFLKILPFSSARTKC